MQHAHDMPTEILEAIRDHDAALARQYGRVAQAVDVLEGPRPRTNEEIVAAANVVLTYGDSVFVQRSRFLLDAALARQAEVGRRDPTPARSSWREIFSIEAFCYALIILGGFYIFCGLAAAVIKASVQQ
jgi:hypothetical protein